MNAKIFLPVAAMVVLPHISGGAGGNQGSGTQNPSPTTAQVKHTQPGHPKQPTVKPCLEKAPKDYREAVCRIAPKYGADPYLVASILFYENRAWAHKDKYVCSHAAACGVAQFIPATFASYGVDEDGDGVPKRESWLDNIASASHYIGKMKKDWRNSAIEYNAGIAYHNAPDSRLPKETLDYVYGVSRAYNYLKGVQ